MRCGEEGKLLARAAGFYHPGEAERIKEPVNSALKFSCHAQEKSSRCPPGLLPIHSHQGEREKNEYSYDGKNTAALPKRT
jgi:hypothetical protein